MGGRLVDDPNYGQGVQRTEEEARWPMTARLTDSDLDEAERLDREATPGPWRGCGADRGSCQCAQVWTVTLASAKKAGM